ncbi:MAG TPA: OsmC family protein [Vicinamibacterales bacterium]|nr:OsmC family protein [Vicinamibacterales bacterium]
MADVFLAHLEWTGAIKGPTTDPAAFSRDLTVVLGAVTLPMSAAPGYRGDPARANPEQLFVASLSGCQALTYLFLAARNHLVVFGYKDEAEGRLALIDGRMRVSRVTLRPRITLAAGTDEMKALELVERAHHDCFIANSVTTTVTIEPAFDFVAAPPRL